jgi:uncharacterized coiled-coil protein SlyX
LFKQKKEAEFFDVLETMTAEKLNLKSQLVKRQKAVELLQQQLQKLTKDLQVSHSGYSPTEYRIFHLYHTFLKEKQ